MTLSDGAFATWGGLKGLRLDVSVVDDVVVEKGMEERLH